MLFSLGSCNVSKLKLIQESNIFKNGPILIGLICKIPKKKLICLNQSSSNSEIILYSMPEAFLSDRNRPQFFTLPVLQRIGKLNLLINKNENKQRKMYCFSEINHELIFLSMEKKSNRLDNSLFVTLTQNKEDILLKMQQIKLGDIDKEVNSNKLQNKILRRDDNFIISNRLTFSKIIVKKPVNTEKVGFTSILLMISLFSLF
jgi:hypothetical protein|mmetsp:Transcript_2921/g.4142  ORF Transcript_2921/g.4142 Transcript_2921/m.4142 type:complete len:203 (+) Transcript_2921:162-770(+)